VDGLAFQFAELYALFVRVCQDRLMTDRLMFEASMGKTYNHAWQPSIACTCPPMRRLSNQSEQDVMAQVPTYPSFSDLANEGIGLREEILNADGLAKVCRVSRRRQP
jgi:hypothetical protein